MEVNLEKRVGAEIISHFEEKLSSGVYNLDFLYEMLKVSKMIGKCEDGFYSGFLKSAILTS